MLGDKEKCQKVESEAEGGNRTRSSLSKGFIFNEFNEFADVAKLVSMPLTSGTDRTASMGKTQHCESSGHHACNFL